MRKIKFLSIFIIAFGVYLFINSNVEEKRTVDDHEEGKEIDRSETDEDEEFIVLTEPSVEEVKEEYPLTMTERAVQNNIH